MENSEKAAVILMILATGLVCSTALGQQGNADEDTWQISITPYFFAPSVDAVSTVSGSPTNTKLGFDDLIDNFDVFGLSGRIEAWKGDWGLFFDGAYTDLEGDFSMQTPGPLIGVDVSIEDAVLDFGAAYRLFDVPLEGDGHRRFTAGPLGGVRCHYMEQEITLGATSPLGPAGTELGGDEYWFEPFVGAHLRYDMTEKLAALVRTDFGGFDIGSGSDLTWNLLAGINWQFKKNMSLKLGYRVMDVQYSRHSGASEFGFDGRMNGPMIGLTMLR